MLKRPIKYTNANDEEVEEVFYFHLSQAELIELEVEYDAGLATALNTIIETQDRKEIIRVFKDIVLRSYGIKTADGKGFEKSDAIRQKFANSFAYSVLFMELATDDGKAAEFVKGIMPKEFADVIEKAELQEKTKAALTKVPDDAGLPDAEPPTPPSA